MDATQTGRLLAPLLAGAVLGPALQLQQAQLPPASGAAAATGLAWVVLALCMWSLHRGAWAARPAWRAPWLLAVATAAAFGLCATRAALYAEGALPAELEGRDLVLTGRVAAMPQHGELGPRFRFEVEEAQAGGQPVRVPRRVLLSWYGGVSRGDAGVFDLQAAAPDLRAGDRWRFVVRLRAPHGNVNPHGFDYELWLWEQGLQATGYVRAGPRDPPAQRLGPTGRHPVERARQAVRDAIHARVADPAAAGVLAALVVGDQNAIVVADNNSVPAARCKSLI